MISTIGSCPARQVHHYPNEKGKGKSPVLDGSVEGENQDSRQGGGVKHINTSTNGDVIPVSITLSSSAA